MNKFLLAAAMVVGMSSRVMAQFCPGCVQNSAAIQNAQFNITSATIRGSLSVGSIGIGSFTATSTVTAPVFVGSGTYLTNLDASKLFGSVPTSSLLGNLSGVTGVGILSTGVWNASIVGTQYGGTGANLITASTGSIPYFNHVGTMAALAPGTPTYLLQTNGATSAPAWTGAPQVLGTFVTAIPMENLLPGQLPTSITVADASISSVSAAKIIGNIPGNASNITGILQLSHLSSGTLNTSNAASSVTASGVTPGIWGGPTQLVQLQVAYDGRITSISQSTFSTSSSSSVPPGPLPGGVTIGAAQITSGTLAGNVIASSIAASGVVPGIYGSYSSVSTFTVNAGGRITSASQVSIHITPSQIDSGTLPGNVLIPTTNIQAGSLGSSVIASSLNVTGVTPGTYGNSGNVAQIVIGGDGRITSATNVGIPGASTNTPFINVDNNWTATQTFQSSVTVNSTLQAAGFVGNGSGITNVSAAALTGVVLIANGGTSSNTTNGARSALGAAASGANADISSFAGAGSGITVSTNATFSQIVVFSSSVTFSTITVSGGLNVASPSTFRSSVTFSSNVFVAGTLYFNTGIVSSGTGISGSLMGGPRGRGAVDLQVDRSTNSQVASGAGSAIGGGSRNTASGLLSTISGGTSNVASGDYTHIGGGVSNTASNNQFATVAGGTSNTATGIGSFIGAGSTNAAGNDHSVIVGGFSNVASGIESSIGGGNNNDATASYTVVTGGSNNIANAINSAVSGGDSNTASGQYSSVSGGRSNTAAGFASAVLGAQFSLASGDGSSVTGGDTNQARNKNSHIGGGKFNVASGSLTYVGGGLTNVATGYTSVVVGGIGNYATTASSSSFIGGGFHNATTSTRTFIGGGEFNFANGYAATVPGGSSNTASGTFSWAGGRLSSATASGSYVWTDSSGFAHSDHGTNTYNIRALGGVFIDSSSLSVADSSITALAYFGDGSHLTGVTAGSVAAANVTAGTLASNVVASSIAVNTVDTQQIVNGAVTDVKTILSTGAIVSGLFGDDRVAITTGALSGTLPIDKGGTGATTAASARSNLSAAQSGTNADINILFGTGSGITIASQETVISSLTVSGNFLGFSSVTASAFFGDGSHLTGLPSSESNTFTSSKTFTQAVLINGLLTGSSSTFSGTVTASTFNAVGSAYQMNGVTVIDHDKNITGSSVTASAFFGYGGNLTGVSLSSTVQVNASLRGDGTSGAPLGVDSSSVAILSSGFVRNSQLDSSSVTLRGNSFNGASQLVLLGGGGALPVLDGSALTGLTAANISAGTLGSAVIASSVAVSGVTAGTYGNATQVSQVTVGIDGRVTSASNVTITGASPTGSAGGVLAGNFPNPTLGSQVVLSSHIANGAITDTKVNLSTGAISAGLFGDDRVAISTNAVISGTWPVARGGTGSTTAPGALSNLGAAASGANADISSLAGTGSGLTISAVTTFTSSITFSSNVVTNGGLAFTTGIVSTGTGIVGSVGGSPRGSGSVDLQVNRSAASQVSSGSRSTIGGGTKNTSSGSASTVGGGDTNTASGDWSFVGGGNSNTASNNQFATVAGGTSNTSSGVSSFIGAGSSNVSSNDHSAVAGGFLNRASGVDSTVGGGNHNTASGTESTVSGGVTNSASGSDSTVGGGQSNTATGANSTVPGGRNNSATGVDSFAAGRQSSATASGAYVWSDAIGTVHQDHGANTYSVRAVGGVFFDSSTITATYGVSATTITATSSSTASAFFGDGSHLTGVATSSYVATVNASLYGDSTTGAPLGVNSSSVAVLSGGLVPNSEIDGSSITKQGQIILITAGGTGATTAVSARANLSAAQSGANSDITSLQGPIAIASSNTGTAFAVSSGAFSFSYFGSSVSLQVPIGLPLPAFNVRVYGGTPSAMTAIPTNTDLGAFSGSGFDGSVFPTGSSVPVTMHYVSSGAWSTSNHGAYFELFTTSVNSISRQRQLTISDNGAATFVSSVTASTFTGSGFGLSNITVSSATIIPNTTFTNTGFTLALATVTATTRGFPIRLSVVGSAASTGGTAIIGLALWIDSAFTAETGSKAIASARVSGANQEGNYSFSIVLNGITSGSHTFAIMAQTSGGTATWFNDSTHYSQFSVTEQP